MRRGDIYRIDRGRGRGRELGGKHYVVVVSSEFVNALNWMITVVPALEEQRPFVPEYLPRLR